MSPPQAMQRRQRNRHPRSDDRPVSLQRGWLVGPAERSQMPQDRAEQARESPGVLYRARASQRLPERVQQWAKKVGMPVPKVLVREQPKRWASCDAHGVLRVNWRIIQAPMRLVDYVVAHELVHLRHADHGRAFWSLLGRVMPDYEERRSALRALGGRPRW